MDPIRASLSEALAGLLEVPADQVAQTLSVPPDPKQGEFALPVFRWSKARGMKPPELAAELAGKVGDLDLVESARAAGPYLNLNLDPGAMGRVLAAPILACPEKVAQAEPNGQTVVIDYSSPNVAKPFHIGHLNTTVLGSSLVKLLRRQGYTVVGVNHLGDWGTQFGKSAVAFQRWGSEEELAAADEKGEGARYLVDLYQRFHKEAKEHPELELDDEARAWFKALEDGSDENRQVWQRFIDVSLREFQEVYRLLNVEFEHYTGESFYEDKIPAAIERLEAAGILEEDQGADVVPMGLDKKGKPKTPLLIRKSDGATLYATRDLAAAFYRVEEFDPVKILYVVGNPQKLHFEQLFAALKLLDEALPEKFEHIGFGHTNFKGLKISTRHGDNVLWLVDVLEQAKKKVQEKLDANIAEKGNYLSEDPEVVAWRIAASALIFGYLRIDRNKDATFDFETAFEFKGDTGPGVQYSHAQLRSILRKVDWQGGEPDWGLLTEPEERNLLAMVGRFHDAIDLACEQRKPNHVAQLLLELRQKVNSYLRREDLPKIKDLQGDLRVARLALVQVVAEVLKTGLELLGIEASEQM